MKLVDPDSSLIDRIKEGYTAVVATAALLDSSIPDLAPSKILVTFPLLHFQFLIILCFVKIQYNTILISHQNEFSKGTTFVRESPIPKTSSAPGTSALPLKPRDKVFNHFTPPFFFLVLLLTTFLKGKEKETFEDLVDEVMQRPQKATKEELKALKAPVTGKQQNETIQLQINQYKIK
jgi:hypothetical protein